MMINSNLRSARWPVLALILTSSLATAGCRKLGRLRIPNNNSKSSQEESPAQTSAEESRIEKMNGYTEGYNKLIGDAGLPATYERYVKENIPKHKAKDYIHVSVGWVDGAYKSLKEARAIQFDGMPELDKSADALIAALDKLVPPLASLEDYYRSKAYKDDDLARGKAEDPAIRAAFEESVKAMSAFNDVLSKEASKRDAELMEKMKADGDVLGYNSKLELKLAEDVVNLFDSEADLKNAEKYKEGDLKIAELEKVMAEQRKAIEVEKAKPKARGLSGHSSLINDLVVFTGEYRSLKESKRARDHESMLKRYNSAVESSNRNSRFNL